MIFGRFKEDFLSSKKPVQKSNKDKSREKKAFVHLKNKARGGKNKWGNLRGHLKLLHFLCSLESPRQGWPPLRAKTLMVRSRVCTPPWQLLEHFDHWVKSDHWQSIGPPIKIYVRTFIFNWFLSFLLKLNGKPRDPKMRFRMRFFFFTISQYKITLRKTSIGFLRMSWKRVTFESYQKSSSRRVQQPCLDWIDLRY